MIWNIVDHRKRRYRWARVNAVIEDTTADNACNDADQLDEDNAEAPMFEELKGASIHEAIKWADAAPGKVTLYLYDEGKGIE